MHMPLYVHVTHLVHIVQMHRDFCIYIQSLITWFVSTIKFMASTLCDFFFAFTGNIKKKTRSIHPKVSSITECIVIVLISALLYFLNTPWQLLLLAVVIIIGYKILQSDSSHHREVEVAQSSLDFIPQRITLQNQFYITVANSKPLQNVVMVNELCARYPDLISTLKTEETFNPIVTVTDKNTGQPIRCVFNGVHDQAKEMCCYLSVKVDVLPFIHHDRKALTYGLQECAPTDEEAYELSLLFCFCQANRDYTITFSVDRITNAEGFECCGYSVDTVKCVVHTVTREQYKASTKSRMVKEMSLIEFSSPCVGKDFDEFCSRFLKLIFQGNQYDAVTKLALETTTNSKQPLDLKVVALCFQGLQLSRDSQCNQEACAVLENALRISNKLECKNGLLLQGRIYRYYSAVYRGRQPRDLPKAQELIGRANFACQGALPSYDTINIICEEAALLENLYGETMSAENRKKVETLWNRGIAHLDCVRYHELPVVCLIYTRKATFHLKSFQVSLSQMHKHPNLRPSKEDIQIAEACLSRVPFYLLDEISTYRIHYFLAKSDVHFWKNEYRDAIASAYIAQDQYIRSKLNDTHMLKLLKERRDLLAKLEVP